MRNLLNVVWRFGRRLRRAEALVEAETGIDLELRKVRFMGFGITDALREELREHGFEEGNMDSPVVVTHSPAPSFIRELRDRYETVVVIGPPGPWIGNASLVAALKDAGAAGVYGWPRENEATELARMLNEALG